MKQCIAIAFGLSLILAMGCERESEPGGPGAANADRGLTQPENSFRLKVPLTETDIKQGETKMIRIGISRARNFDQDVKLEFSGAPTGVTVTPANRELKASSEDMQVTLEAARDAALGEHTVTVKGTPARSGSATSTTFKIDVKKAD